MTADLILIHVVFILACAGGSWFAGWKQGKRDIINMFIDDDLVTVEQLENKYSDS